MWPQTNNVQPEPQPQFPVYREVGSTTGFVCEDADNFGRTLRLRRMPFVHRRRRKPRNVGDRSIQSSGAILHRGGLLVGHLNPACITIGIMAHEIRICDSTRTNRCRTANSNSLRSNSLVRFWRVWDGAVRRIARIISSASLEIDHRALPVSCYYNENRRRRSCRNIGIWAAPDSIRSGRGGASSVASTLHDKSKLTKRR